MCVEQTNNVTVTSLFADFLREHKLEHQYNTIISDHIEHPALGDGIFGPQRIKEPK